MAISYSEDDYLYKDNPDMMDELEKLRLQLDESKRKKLILEEKRIEAYYEFINLVANLIYDLGIKDNSISYSVLISTLALKGYFSENKIKSFSNTPKYDASGFYGMDVIAGNCCCRHFAFFHRDVFDKLGQFSYLFPCVMLEENPSNASANHLVNIIKYGDNLYSYDVGNQLLFGFINGLELQRIHPSDDTDICYKPYMDMELNGISREQILKRIKLLLLHILQL